ncbi:outer membrane lipid asymmetry maintenance protein MlaD [Entomomonas sp. E2T0]|uniref:outer membrane lipid asymmetry maintenance protein MlaD n=1 Tax=Entomomonas sp. E2T0 TaxID=2930213 RepID=UPI00222812A2|nr:outer membrane lipid asymmetry maintenance protein MlaD [Entomomonas sp. E2T0]UYZ83880.1 outer membrane lipid asymmetry maintenance protein MlaD [Entomomonas sp. E2T0]
MNNRALEITVGLFVLAGILALALLAFRVSGLTLGDTGQGSYKVTAYFDNVDGLKVRSRVAFAGVTIGKVTAIEMAPKQYQAKVTLELNGDVNYLPEDSTAIIYTAGLLGEKYVGFSLGGEEEVLKEGSVIKDTQSTLVLEDLINKFVMGSDDSGKEVAKQLQTMNDTLKELVKTNPNITN